MGRDDAENGFALPAFAAKRSPQASSPTDESAVNEVETVTVSENVKINSKSANLKEILVIINVRSHYPL